MAPTQVELPLRNKAQADGDASQNGVSGPVAFGHTLRDEQFLFEPGYRNLNHGKSYIL
jgi:hypothetical protein